MLYLAVIFPFIAHFLPTENKNIKLSISIAPAIFIILFRWGLGTDYFSYEYLYNNHDVSSLENALNSQVDSMEVFFRFIIYVFKSLNFSFQVFVASISLTIYGFFVKWLIDSDYSLPLSIALLNGMFFVVWTLGVLRQGLVLSIGTYLFFNKKFDLTWWQSIIAIFLLGQIHASAYIYFVLIILKQFNFSRKQLLFVTLLSLVFTVIPYYKLFEPFSNIRIVEKFLTYVRGSSGFWDFPGLIRLAFVIFILVFYNYFKKDKYIKKLADMSMVGFSFYYLLKISEITASRINIFTFILIIPLIVYLTKEFSNTKLLYFLALLGILSFSLLYLQKDLTATQSQAGKDNIETVYRMNFFSKAKYEDYYLYDNQFAFLTYNSGYCSATKEISYPKIRPITQGNIVIKDYKKDRFGVLNENGDWIIEPIYKDEPDLYGDLIAFHRLDGSYSYYNFDKEYITGGYSTATSYKLLKQKIDDEAALETSISIDKYRNDLSAFFTNVDRIEESKILNYKLPFEYNLLSLKYKGNYYYLYLNEHLEIHNGMIFNAHFKFDHNNMALAKTFCGNVVLNSNGDIVYK